MASYKNFTVDHRGGVTTVTLEVPQRPLNVLTAEVMSELQLIVGELESSDEIKAVVFRSGKESGFLAGADVSAIAEIKRTAQAMRLVELGQTLFQRIEWLPMPTIAVIHGPCLGGGIEWALACDHRIARDNSSTKIGLPEIKLGLIPGWGGTQRLPRLVGLTESLSMILTGKYVDAKSALRIGLIDQAISPNAWERGVNAFVDRVIRGQNTRSISIRRRLWRMVVDKNPIGRALVFHFTERSIGSKVIHYPALSAAMRAIRSGYQYSMDGIVAERIEFVSLLKTTTCRRLLELFFARERARTLSTWAHAPSIIHGDWIRHIGVVGAGAMGAGISQLAATRGYDVAVKEINQEAAMAGKRRITKLINTYVTRKGLAENEASDLMAKIELGTEDQLLSDCDLVIEAAVENADVKDKIFATLDHVTKPSAILTSNTSALSVTRMADATKRPELVAGLHFFNPVHRMELVEVVRAAKTSDETVGRLVALAKALGKTPIVTSDSPGFLVNRVLFPYLGEAVLMVAEGGDPEAIDKEVRRFGMPMGPLELLDQVGIDVALHVSQSLGSILVDAQRVAQPLQVMVDRGRLGKKSGQGFYRYGKGKRKSPSEHRDQAPPNEVVGLKKLSEHAFQSDGLTVTQRRLVYPMLCEAVRAHQDGVVSQAWAIDLAMVLGTGFAPHRGGPLHVIDDIGVDHVVANLEVLRLNFGDRFNVPDELVRMSNLGETFFETPQAYAEPVSERDETKPGELK
jgi:3-hydroxyacyl-CoA dehydrogenase/enoyl-CoA hydratase/3-hydroxybutyryl-CoA epimerase